MKIYISADIEGVAGIAAAPEANRAIPGEYQPFRDQMAAEVMAACRGAFSDGATSILIKDAHGTGRNLVLADFAIPASCRLELIRGWSGHPFGMVQDMDESFDGAIFIGFHCAAGEAGNPLAHTLNGALFSHVELNGATASELRLYALAAATVKVPILFVSGDATVCSEARKLIPGVSTLDILKGSGPSIRSIAPVEAVRRIEEEVQRAMRRDFPAPLTLPEHFTLRLEFRNAADAYARSFYPGVSLISARTLELKSEDYLAILTFLRFASRYT